MESLGCLLAKGLPFLWNLITGSRICNASLQGLCLPYGKSTIVKSLEAQKKNVKLIDLDSSALLEVSKEDETRLKELKEKNELQTYNQKVMVISRDYVFKLQKDFKGQKFILVSANYELLKFVGCKTGNIVSFCPSNDFWSKVRDTLEPAIVGVVDNVRQQLILNNKKLQVFSSFDQLYEIASRIFELKAKL
jgi:hypothetical protein